MLAGYLDLEGSSSPASRSRLGPPGYGASRPIGGFPRDVLPCRNLGKGEEGGEATMFSYGKIGRRRIQMIFFLPVGQVAGGRTKKTMQSAGESKQVEIGVRLNREN